VISQASVTGFAEQGGLDAILKLANI